MQLYVNRLLSLPQTLISTIKTTCVRIIKDNKLYSLVLRMRLVCLAVFLNIYKFLYTFYFLLEIIINLIADESYQLMKNKYSNKQLTILCKLGVENSKE